MPSPLLSLVSLLAPSLLYVSVEGSCFPNERVFTKKKGRANPPSFRVAMRVVA